MSRNVHRWMAVVAMVVVVLAMALMLRPASASPVNSTRVGSGSCTTDTTGYCTITHDLGVVPTHVDVTTTGGFNISVNPKTATTFRVRFCRGFTNSDVCRPVVSGVVAYSWEVVSAGMTPPPSPTPSESATPTPTPAPSSTALLAACFPRLAECGYPHLGNTGVPPATTLTAYTGPSTITTAGTVIDGKTMGCVQIRALNVTIRWRGSIPVRTGPVVNPIGAVRKSRLDAAVTGPVPEENVMTRKRRCAYGVPLDQLHPDDRAAIEEFGRFLAAQSHAKPVDAPDPDATPQTPPSAAQRVSQGRKNPPHDEPVR